MAEEAKQSSPSFWSETEKGQKAELFLSTQNQYDISHWIVLIKEAQLRNIEDGRCMFERVLKTFPTSVRFIKLYIDGEFKANNFDNVEKIYVRFLKKSHSVELYKNYINFLKETRSKEPDYRDVMQKAYEFALENVGIDYQSFHIWNDYISFLKSTEAPGSYAEGQKILLLRKVYQQALLIPMMNGDQIWKEYSLFEQNVSKTLSEKLLAEKLKEFSNARRVAKEIESHTKTIHRHALPLPPNSYLGENMQKSLWRKYLNWEKSNPLGMENLPQLVRRVVYLYKQFLNSFYHHHDVWTDACQYVERIGYEYEHKDKATSDEFFIEASNFYETALKGPLVKNIHFHFSFADFHEMRKNYGESANTYESLLENNSEKEDRSIIYIQYMKHLQRVKGVNESRKIFKRARLDQNITYHVFVVAALQELIIYKDQLTSLKILELGLKRFIHEPEFLTAYLEHLNNLSDCNNVRMLYERLLHNCPSNSIKTVLSNFHRYESDFGSLKCIIELENRISSKYMQEANFHSLLADRYSFREITASTSHFRLSSLKLNETLSSSHQQQDNPIIRDPKSIPESQRFVPNIVHMRPFKPVHSTVQKYVFPKVAIGGMFNPPAMLLELLQKLPAANCFQGPFVDLQKLMEFYITQSFDIQPHEYMSSRVVIKLQSNIENESNENTEKGSTSDQPKSSASDSVMLDPIADIFQIRHERRLRAVTST